MKLRYTGKEVATSYNSVNDRTYEYIRFYYVDEEGNAIAILYGEGNPRYTLDGVSNKQTGEIPPNAKTITLGNKDFWALNRGSYPECDLEY